jgi:hypothetical protein
MQDDESLDMKNRNWREGVERAAICGWQTFHQQPTLDRSSQSNEASPLLPGLLQRVAAPALDCLNLLAASDFQVLGSVATPSCTGT